VKKQSKQKNRAESPYSSPNLAFLTFNYLFNRYLLQGLLN